MLRTSLVITLLLFAADAIAGPPDAWRAFDETSNPGGRGCAPCHGSANIQTWPSNNAGPNSKYLQGLDSGNFLKRINSQNATMMTLASDCAPPPLPATPPAYCHEILQYLLDVRDGKVIKSLVLDSATIDSATASEGTVTIANERSRPLTYTVPTFSSSNGFSVRSQSCATREVPAGGSCTLTVQFLPRSPPFASDNRESSMNFRLQGTGIPTSDPEPTGGTPNPGTRSVSMSASALTPLEITTASLLPFTATQPNSSVPQSVSIGNRLAASLRLCLVNEVGSPFSAPGDFILIDRSLEAGERCVTVANPGATPIQDVSFKPSASGPRLARFTVQRVNGGTLLEPLVSIALQGNVGPFASVSGTGLTNSALFDGVRQDINAGAATPSVVTLTNAGNQPLRIASISIPFVSGAGNAEYATSGCTASAPLLPSASCDLSVSFDPIDVGTRASQLLIGYSDPADTQASRRVAVIGLQGQGTRGATLVVRDAGGNKLAAASSVAFGQQNIAITYMRRITLSNIGTDETLAVSAPVLTPSGSGFEFFAPGGAGSCAPLAAGINLLAGSTCFVDLRFAPAAVSSYSATLRLPNRAAGASSALSDFVLNLSGDGVDGRPRLGWQTTAGGALSLLKVPGLTAVGSASPPQVNLRLANLGPGAAALRLLNVTGADASNFSIDATAPGRCSVDSAAPPLLEGASCEVVITFRPNTAGAKTGGLQIVSTGTTPAPLEIRAQASGPAATISLRATPSSVNLGEVRVGAQSAPATVTITNDGTVAAVVTRFEASAGFAVEQGSCGAPPLSIEPRGNCVVTVRFGPGGAGNASGTLRVQVSGMAAPVEVPLEGTGTAAADVSGGGCSMSDGRSHTDPTLWALALIAGLALHARERRRIGAPARSENSPPP